MTTPPRRPVFVAHGTADRVVPLGQGATRLAFPPPPAFAIPPGVEFPRSRRTGHDPAVRGGVSGGVRGGGRGPGPTGRPAPAVQVATRPNPHLPRHPAHHGP